MSLRQRLEARRAEIEEAVLTRVHAVSDPSEVGDADYVAGLREAVRVGVDYGLKVAEGQEIPLDLPVALAAQARHAARNGVGLDTVLRRYFAGYTLLGEFVMQEIEASRSLATEEIHRLSRAQASLFDRFVVAVTEEHTRETKKRLPNSVERRRTRCVEALLAGELVDSVGLDYEFDAHHIGMAASGPEVVRALRDLALALDRHLLSVHPSDDTVWAWLGGRNALGASKVAKSASERWPAEACLAIGEPGRGLVGWRCTHRQAIAAIPIALREVSGVVRYADVALLTAAAQDDLLADSLRQLYVAPLADERDDGMVLRQTLRAYFNSAQNVSSAAAGLGISRKTVASRLRTVEQRIGRPLDDCAPELQIALRLVDFASPKDDGRAQT